METDDNRRPIADLPEKGRREAGPTHLTPCSVRSNAVHEFIQAHRSWFAEHNRLIDEVGVFGESLRPW
ncbi:MAG: hypothetical protein RL722_103 [Pseudomonadota bacterium]|jgi:hypothetical protein